MTELVTVSTVESILVLMGEGYLLEMVRYATGDGVSRKMGIHLSLSMYRRYLEFFEQGPGHVSKPIRVSNFYMYLGLCPNTLSMCRYSCEPASNRCLRKSIQSLMKWDVSEQGRAEERREAHNEYNDKALKECHVLRAFERVKDQIEGV